MHFEEKKRRVRDQVFPETSVVVYVMRWCRVNPEDVKLKLFSPELFFFILAHPVYKT